MESNPVSTAIAGTIIRYGDRIWYVIPVNFIRCLKSEVAESAW
ncbi:MAG: hypothetical protein RMY29_004300 [Nostoc sp. CreGUA01]|nr:hypothetical protein [Nostoc sp. CreGUA01]